MAIGKTGVLSVSHDYSAVDMFSDNWIDAIRQDMSRICAFAWSAFFAGGPFLGYLPQSSLKLWKSDPLMEKFQNFAFLPSFTKISKAELTKRVHGIHHKKVGILHLSLWLPK